MKQDDDDLLDRLSGLVSDGADVDWDRSRRGAGSDQVERWVRNLRTVSEVSRLARGGAAGVVDSPPVRGAARRSIGPEAAPAQWGHLRILELLGHGSFGDVFRAWDERLHRDVALKLLHGTAKDGPDPAAQSLREGRLLARIEHPNVVRIYGVDAHDGRVGFWMELIRGADLEEMVAGQGMLDPDQAIEIGAQLCGGLTAIHEAGVVHQDLKPRNILRTPEGRIVITDFGAGRMRPDRGAHGVAELSGTPLYMAPELLDTGHPTPRSDIYSLGVVLYYLLTGSHPVSARTWPEIIALLHEGRRTPLGQARPDLPGALVGIVERAADPDPERRFRSATEMRTALLEARSPAASTGSPAERRIEEGTVRPGISWRKIAYAAGPLLAFLLVYVLTRSFSPGALDVAADFKAVRDGTERSLRPGDDITPADILELEIDPDRRAHLYVLNVDETGAVVVLFPVPGLPLENPVEPGSQRTIPGIVNGERRGWVVNDVRGAETFLVLASTRRMEAFEEELSKIPAIPASGVQVRPLDSGAVRVLTRGVVSMTRVPAVPQRDDATGQLVELLTTLAGGDSDKRTVWVGRYVFHNTGAAP